jgi:hypothetical protein
MTPTDFECLLKIIGGKIWKENKKFSVVHMVKTRSVLTHWLLQCPPNTSTLEILRSVMSVNPTPHGTQGTRIWAESEQLLFFVAVLWGCSDSAEIQPQFSPSTFYRNIESECVQGFKDVILCLYLWAVSISCT